MTDIEKQALKLLNEIEVEFGRSHLSERIAPGSYVTHKALCRAIEQHEAFRQDVSDALIEEFGESYSTVPRHMHRFIVVAKPKTDPLEEVLAEKFGYASPVRADNLRAALAARGLEIREVE